MKIEKLNDNQVRCTLTFEDLAERQIRLQELVYGSGKARALFGDMLSEARACGFDPEGGALMIEAVPLKDCIVMTITRVDDAEELDTRFSKFTAAPSSEALPEFDANAADDILDIFHKLLKSRTSGDKGSAETGEKTDKKEETAAESAPVSCLCLFKTLDDAITAASELPEPFTGKNALYRLHDGSGYALTLHQDGISVEAFRAACSVLSEYASFRPLRGAQEARMKEHDTTLFPSDALTRLRELA